MAFNKPEAVETEHFDFGSSSADLHVTSKRNVRSEVTNKPLDVEATLDAFESAKGIKRRKGGVGMEDYTFKNIILDPDQQKDQDMLNELLNNKKYLITLWKDTWTTAGNYRVFVIYGAKKDKEPEVVN